MAPADWFLLEVDVNDEVAASGVMDRFGGFRYRPSGVSRIPWVTLDVSVIGAAGELKRTVGHVKTRCCVLECILTPLS